MVNESAPAERAAGPSAPPRPCRLLTRTDVEHLLDMPACIAAVEGAFRMRADGRSGRSGVLGVHAERGGFHAKAAILGAGDREAPAYFAAKLNANFPENPARHALPTIQGLLALFDADTGVPLAIMDSIAITILRTAAATAIATRYLAAPDASTVTIVGCGAQAPAQLAAVCAVRPVSRAFACDANAHAAERFARRATQDRGILVEVSDDLRRATAASEIIVTCTTSRRAFLGAHHLSPGAFVAAVGADNEDKQEIEPELMASSAVVVDSREQCTTIGDLHHALAAGHMRVDDVRAELGEVIADPSRGRRSADETVIFDSTGVAIQDVAAAALVYERAVHENGGTIFEFSA